MIHAYYKEYLEYSQKNIGDMVDYAVNTLNMDIEDFWNMFVFSKIAKECERGNTTYVAGMNGCEIADDVLKSIGLEGKGIHVLHIDKSPEYWCGWVLAYYQWLKAIKYSKIQAAISIKDIRKMYNTMHEADISKFVSCMNEKMSNYYKDTNLKHYRKLNNLSQGKLAKEAEVPLRQIQMIEQRRRDINKMNLESVIKLARVLHCEPQDLYEVDFTEVNI